MDVAAEHQEPKGNALLWARICFQRLLVFQEAQPLLGFTGLLIPSVSPEAVLLLSDPADNLPGQGGAGDVGGPGFWPWLCPSWRGPWTRAFAPGLPFSYPLSTGVVAFPVISFGSQTVCLCTGMAALKGPFQSYVLPLEHSAASAASVPRAGPHPCLCV